MGKRTQSQTSPPENIAEPKNVRNLGVQYGLDSSNRGHACALDMPRIMLQCKAQEAGILQIGSDSQVRNTVSAKEDRLPPPNQDHIESVSEQWNAVTGRIAIETAG